MAKTWSNFSKLSGNGAGKKPLNTLVYYRVSKDGTPEQKCCSCSKWLAVKGNFSVGQRTPLGVDRSCLKCKGKARRERYAKQRPYTADEVYAKHLEGADFETLSLYFHTGKPQISRMIHEHERGLRKAKVLATKTICGGPMRKSVLAMPDGMWDAVDDAVGAHHYPSRSEFIRQAVREKLALERQEQSVHVNQEPL